MLWVVNRVNVLAVFTILLCKSIIGILSVYDTETREKFYVTFVYINSLLFLLLKPFLLCILSTFPPYFFLLLLLKFLQISFSYIYLAQIFKLPLLELSPKSNILCIVSFLKLECQAQWLWLANVSVSLHNSLQIIYSCWISYLYQSKFVLLPYPHLSSLSRALSLADLLVESSFISLPNLSSFLHTINFEHLI